MTQHWRGCLQVTGGNLNPEKGNWILIGFFWDDNGQYHYRMDIASNLWIPNASGRMQAIERLGLSNATQVVGVYQAADGNMREQFLHLKAMANDIGSHISKGYLPKKLLWETLHTMIFPSISYPLGSTMLAEAESELITKSLYAQLLPSGSTNHNYPTEYCHAPSMFYGLALPMVIKTQFTKQVKKMLIHGAIPTLNWNGPQGLI
jgi:hypothetical protein